MARFLAIDWDRQKLRVLDVTGKGGRLQVQRAVTWPESFALNPKQAQEAGQQLQRRLQVEGIAAAPVLVLVPADLVLFCEVRFTDVPANEVADVIHLQVAKQLSFPAEEVIIDYTVLTHSGTSQEKRALAVVLRKDALSALHTFCHAAGLSLESVSVRPYGIHRHWLAQGPKSAPGTASALFLVSSDIGEVCLVQEGELLFSRSLTHAGNRPVDGLAPCVPELRRILAAISNRFPTVPVTTLFVSGTAAECEALSKELGSELRVLSWDPLALAGLEQIAPAEGMAFVPLLGAARAKVARQALPIDFLAPKEPKPLGRHKRYLQVACGIGLGLLLGCAALMVGLALSARNAEIHELQTTKAQLKKQVEAFGDEDKRLEAITTWTHGEVVILDELYDLFARFPDQPGIRVTRVAWSPLHSGPDSHGALGARPQAGHPSVGSKTHQATAPTGRKPIAQIALEVRAESPETLESFRQALAAEAHWKMESWDREPGPPFLVRARLKVFAQAPQDYRLTLAKTAHVTANVGVEKNKESTTRVPATGFPLPSQLSGKGGKP